MKKVECNDCKNFIRPILKDEEDLFSGVITNAKCKIGKRVLFQKPKTNNYYDTGGYFRNCNDFIDSNQARNPLIKPGRPCFWSTTT